MRSIVRFVTAVSLALAIVTTAGCAQTECKSRQWQCNDRCGNGIVGKLCQDVCTVRYNTCLRRKAR